MKAGIWVALAAAGLSGAALFGARSEEEKAVLMRTDAEFSEAAQRLGVGEAFARYADQSAVLMPGGAEPVRGPEAIRRHFAHTPAGATLRWKPFEAQASRSGDLGYTLGTYEYAAPGPDGKPSKRYGKYCTVWKKQAGGSWKWVADIGNASPEPPAGQ